MKYKAPLGWYYVALAGSLALLAIAYFYFQQYKGLFPCPLCMLQRACLVAIALVALIGIVHRPGIVGHYVYATMVCLAGVTGSIIAGRQTWLQHLPKDQVPECGFDPIYRWSQSDGSYGFFDMLATTLKGSGDCAEVDWTLFSFSMAEWMLAIFIVITAIAAYLIYQPKLNR